MNIPFRDLHHSKENSISSTERWWIHLGLWVMNDIIMEYAIKELPEVLFDLPRCYFKFKTFIQPEVAAFFIRKRLNCG
jgi:hypothetical protein